MPFKKEIKQEIRTRLYKFLLRKLALVLKEELNKNQTVLASRMSEGNTYKDFLENLLNRILEITGPIEDGPSFLKDLYLESIGGIGFENVSAKNLILSYFFRFNAIKEEAFFSIEDARKIYSIILDRIQQNEGFINRFNLQEMALLQKLKESVKEEFEIESEFLNTSYYLLETQSARVTNLINELVIERLTESLEKEKLLKQELAQRHKYIEEALKKARKIQLNLLPQPKNLANLLNIGFRYIPVESVGGDFYDVINLQYEHDFVQRIGFIIADVSGHGIPSAFIASMTKIIWQNSFSSQEHPAGILKKMNTGLLPLSIGNFLTAFLAIFDIYTQNLHEPKLLSEDCFCPRGVMHYSSAGHFPAYVIRKKDKSSFSVNTKGRVIGVFPEIKLENKSMDIFEGDRIIFYTDGFLEARSKSDREILGEKRLFQIFDSYKDLSVEKFCDEVSSQILTFSGGKYDDDMTLVVFDII